MSTPRYDYRPEPTGVVTVAAYTTAPLRCRHAIALGTHCPFGSDCERVERLFERWGPLLKRLAET